MTATPDLAPDAPGPSQELLPTASALEDLIVPIPLEEFLGTYWERDFLFISRGNPSFYRSIFSLADVDRCILSRTGDPEEALTVVPEAQSGEKPRSYRASDLRVERLYEAFKAGATIRLEGVQKSWPPVAALVAAIEEALNIKLNVNFYLTPADSQGFNLHYDPHDVFILQVDGAKEWYLYEPDISLPVERLLFQDLPEVTEYRLDEDSAKFLRKVRLEKGDLLYLPRGFPHKAVAVGTPSLHLTVGIHPVYWLDFLKVAIERACVEDPAARRSLDPGFLSDTKVAQRMRESFRSILEAACARADFDEALKVVAKDHLRSRAFPADGHFAQLAELGKLDLHDLVRHRPGVSCTVELDGGSVALHFAGRTIQTPVAVHDALVHIRDRRQFRVADLPGLSDQSKLVLVRRLIGEGLLARASESGNGAFDRSPA